MAQKNIRTGVIGVGYLGRWHAEKYAKMDGVDLVGVVDPDMDRAKGIADKEGTTAFSGHEALFGKVDAVSIVAPTPLHHAIARDFLSRGVDVFVEKPITTTVAEAAELVDLAEKGDLILQVGHIERFNPAVIPLNGVVNDPLFIECHRLSMYTDRCTDVSVVLDLMIHDIDIILSFVPSPIKEIRASGVPVISRFADIANARLEFESGCVANVTASRISLKSQRKFRIFQRDAYVSLDFANHQVTVIKPDLGPGGELDQCPIPGMDIQSHAFDKGDALMAELTAFVASVRTRTPPAVTGEMGKRALEVAMEVMERIETACKRFSNGSPMPWQLPNPDA